MNTQFDHPRIDLDATDLHKEFERFRCHVSFIFHGPLLVLQAKQKAGWRGTWIGEQGGANSQKALEQSTQKTPWPARLEQLHSNQ